MQPLRQVADAPQTSTRRQQSRARERVFKAARLSEHAYARALRKIARQIDDMVRVLHADTPALRLALRRYAAVLGPWAKSVAAVMLRDVARRDDKVWHERSKGMARDLRREIAGAPIGDVVKRLMDEQVHLITSLPLKAAQRVHELAIKQLSEGDRPRSITAEIMRTGEVTMNRANLIARTEAGRATTALTEARSLHVGSEGYIWRTAHDADVRERHRKLEGKFFKWTDPPVTGENGERSHPGSIYNCRCWPEVVVPDVVD